VVDPGAAERRLAEIYDLQWAERDDLDAYVALAGEYGHRGRALAVPARLGHGRLLGVVEIELDPVDRVAFDNAAGARAPR